MNAVVYGLSATPDSVRYIGVTAGSLRARLDRHVGESLSTRGTHKRHWLRAALDADQSVEIELLDTAPTSSEALWLERLWIAVYRACGVPLTNACDGGRGCLSPTDQTRRKMRDSHLGKKDSAETIARKSEAHKGKPYPKNRKRRIVTEAFRQRIRELALGRSHSAAAKERISAAKRGQLHSESTKALMSKRQVERWNNYSESERAEVVAAATAGRAAAKGAALKCR